MLSPSDETELAEAVATAQGALRIAGGATRLIGHTVAGQELTTRVMTGITLYEPGALTLVARTGTPVADIEAALASEGQMLPFEPLDHRNLFKTNGDPTVGGMVAANVSGPRRVQAGACRDSLIGVRFVDGVGNVVKNGGRVMKNVTGYDLVKLLAGSYGTLGILSEVSFKVLPAPDACAVVLINGLGVEDAVRAMSMALSSPFEVSGAAHAPSGVDDHPVTMIRVEGFEASATYRAGRLKDLLSGFGDIAIETDPTRTKAGWTWVRNAEVFDRFEGDIWRVSLKPSDAPALVHALEDSGGGFRFLLDWGGGLVWVGAPPGRDIRSSFANGHATLVRASEETKARIGVFHPEPAPLDRLAEGLRQQFDPKRILNPGLMG